MIYVNFFDQKMVKFEPKLTRNRAIAILFDSVKLVSTLNGMSFGTRREVMEKRLCICCISTGRRWYTPSPSKFYEIEVLFWSETDFKNTPSFSVQMHAPIQWMPRYLIAAIWESVVGMHCITVFEMENPHDPSKSTNITTVNNILSFFDKSLNVLKFQLAFGLLNVNGGKR